MNAHKTSLDERAKNLTDAKASAEALDNRLSLVENDYALIANESLTLDTMLLQLMKAVQPAIKANSAAKLEVELDKSLKLPEMPFLNVTADPAA